MRITNIENDGDIYIVTFKASWFDKLFWIKDEVKQYKTTGKTYLFGSGGVYVNKNGEELHNGSWIAKEIDKFRRRF